MLMSTSYTYIIFYLQNSAYVNNLHMLHVFNAIPPCKFGGTAVFIMQNMLLFKNVTVKKIPHYVN
jgi:hypothetical protein